MSLVIRPDSVLLFKLAQVLHKNPEIEASNVRGLVV